MISSTFPDVNVWLALLLENHVHRAAARRWLESTEPGLIGFLRVTQMSVLRLLTTPAAMNGKPLRMPEAWAAYDRLFNDDRVTFFNEPRGIDDAFRKYARKNHASPKLWADAWLLAFAECADGVVVTFDRALAVRAKHTVLLS
jgi:toxin-antitoxin system PIN domain toxin